MIWSVQKTFDNAGRGLSLKIHPKDAKLGTGHSRLPALEVFSVLQHCSVNEPCFCTQRSPIESRHWGVCPTHPLSSRKTVINIRFNKPSILPKVTVVSMIPTLSMLCPNLQFIYLQTLPRDLMILLSFPECSSLTNGILQYFVTDSLLTEEACEVAYELPDLHKWFFVIGRDTLLPLAVLLIYLTIIGHDNHKS